MLFLKRGSMKSGITYVAHMTLLWTVLISQGLQFPLYPLGKCRLGVSFYGGSEQPALKRLNVATTDRKSVPASVPWGTGSMSVGTNQGLFL